MDSIRNLNTASTRGLSAPPINGGLKKSDETSPVINDKVEIGGNKPAAPEKELTVLFYMNGQYDDIGPRTAATMLDLERAGSDANVNVVSELGRNPYKPKTEGESHIPVDNDWSGARRYEVKHDLHTNLDVPVAEYHKLEEKIPNNPVLYYCIGDEYWSKGDRTTALKYFDKAKQLGMADYIENPGSEKNQAFRKEIDDATKHLDDSVAANKVFASQPTEILDPSTAIKDPQTLKDFVSWGMQKYPAKNYVLVVMAHGGAWLGASAMPPAQMGPAIADGVKDANAKTGRSDKISDLIMNACYMGNAESLYEMKDAADISIASENYATTGIFDDWTRIIGGLQKDAKEGKPFDAMKFSKEFVEAYREENLDVKNNFPEFAPWKKAYLTLTAVDNKQLDGLKDAFKLFNEECTKHNVSDKELFTAVKDAKNYASTAFNPSQVFGFYDKIRDLGGMMDNIAASPTIPQEVKDAAAGVKEALKKSIINEQHEGVGMEGSQGLTFWGPDSGVDVAFMLPRYNDYVGKFAKDSGWSDRLKTAINNVPKPTVQGFMDSYRKTVKIKEQLADPNVAPEEKAKLKAELEIEEKKVAELKTQMDFTREPEVKTMMDAFNLEPPIDLGAYGNMVDGIVNKLPEQGGMQGR
ncbi:MAG: clostripain-related cysteine peptidase [Firmicutes bacterium]|nr:clostripain-related cysteine peptidase [Bacillota bacterium]